MRNRLLHQITRPLLTAVVMLLMPRILVAGPVKCDLSHYQPHPGLSAVLEGDLMVLTWSGQSNEELRMRFAVDNNQPVIRDLAVRTKGSPWFTLGNNLVPEYRVTSGTRRMSEQQAAPLRALGVEITPEIIDKNKWYAFWDAPLEVPGIGAGKAPPNQACPADRRRSVALSLPSIVIPAM